MAEASGGDGLTRRRERARWPVWLARAGAVASAALLVISGLRLLLAAGIAPRWSVDRERVAASATGRPVRAAEVVDPRPSAEQLPVVTTALEPPDDANGTVPAGAGPPARIDFEAFPGGQSSCSPCAVSDEWEAAGLVVSFRSWTADSRRPHLLDGRDYLPDGSSVRVLGPPFREGMGLEVGVIRLDFPGRPRSVTFSVFGPDIVPDFDITAWSGQSVVKAAVGRSLGRRYDIAGRGMFREEIVDVRIEDGIDRISIDGWGPPGHLVFVDHVVITP